MTALQKEYRTIPLTQGKVALVDASDYAQLIQFRWHAAFDPRGNRWYAIRAARSHKRTPVKMHRQIMGLQYGERLYVDHADGDGLNNRKVNLRICTQMQNSYNRGANANNKLGFKGVHFYPKTKKYAAHITANHKRIHLGYFNTPEEAHEAYCKASALHHGKFSGVIQ